MQSRLRQFGYESSVRFMRPCRRSTVANPAGTPRKPLDGWVGRLASPDGEVIGDLRA
jgi:hypothetical protein